MIDVIFEDNHLLVAIKPCNIATQADQTNDLDFLTMCKAYLKEKYQKPGNVYLGLIHRLDRPVSGIMVFAKTSKAASRLSDQIRTHQFKKTYLAIVEGKLTTSQTWIDDLLKDTKTNMVKVVPAGQGKKSILHFTPLATKQQQTLVKIQLETGRPHQIRVQFSSRKHPLLYDQRYHPYPKKGQIALYAYQVEFLHPITKQPLCFQAPKPTQHPFSLFQDVL